MAIKIRVLHAYYGCENAAALRAQDLVDCDNTISDLTAEVERLREGEPCNVCGGSGTPVSGLPCACGGSGKLWRAEQNIRRECLELRAENAALRASLRQDSERNYD